ncbi:MAG: hypothetical protein NT099_04155 [Candidatus Saganbacteria bacterium]|nr:hypothetical protein [Candidatus Saganbacteria bacterium]
MFGIEGVSENRIGNLYDNFSSVGPDPSTEKFIDILQSHFDQALNKLEEISPGVYTTKTNPVYAAYQNYGNNGTIA